ncbi:hypothetical protein BGZ46_008443 [Entomortierella lignicola]|nr:hypothetical protein BGZ46_008443 [Entomortierella lignicola]
MERNLEPCSSELPYYRKQHALHITEIVEMIVSHLTTKEILLCRGVSKEWRLIFSSHLQLHAIYWNHNHIYKVKFEERLETLGPFVQSLKQVYPTQETLNRIKRTCPELTRVGFFLRDKTLLDTEVLTRFFQAMKKLERVDIFSHNERLVASCLVSLASYHAPMDSASTSNQAMTPQQSSRASLRELDIGVAPRSMSFPSIEWSLLEIVLTRHSQLKNLTVREVHISEAIDFNTQEISWTKSVGLIFGQQAQRKWGEMLNKIRGRSNWKKHLPESISGTATADLTVFNHLETLEFNSIRISEELFVGILCRCPALKALDLKLTGVEIPMRAWLAFLPHCPQLASITVNNNYGGICMDVPNIWALAPSLDTFRIKRTNGPEVYFSGLNPSLNNIASPIIPHPGKNLVSLELCCNISIADIGVCSVMSHCQLLEKLVLELQYFTEWEEQPLQPSPYPKWACGETLKILELRTVYRRHDQQFDERVHLFMTRLQDLKVLERLTLPGKLLSDMSESGNGGYAAFRDLLARLDIQDHHDNVLAQMQLATSADSTNHQTTEQQQPHQPQGQVWIRDGSGPVNFIPQMPSVKFVRLTAPSGYRFLLEMRHLHILMEALPGLKIIWTSKEFYGVDCIPRFKYFHGRFQDLYGLTGVELNLGLPTEGEQCKFDK